MMNPRHRPSRQVEAFGLEVTIMTPDEFCDAVLLAVADTHGVPQPKIDRWASRYSNRSRSVILREARYLDRPGDVGECAARIAERILED
jgi:hypothetical protein